MSDSGQWNLPPDQFDMNDWNDATWRGKHLLREFRRDALAMACDLEGEAEAQPLFRADDDERILARAQKFYEWIMDAHPSTPPHGHQADLMAMDEVHRWWSPQLPVKDSDDHP